MGCTMTAPKPYRLTRRHSSMTGKPDGYWIVSRETGDRAGFVRRDSPVSWESWGFFRGDRLTLGPWSSSHRSGAADDVWAAWVSR